MRMAVVAVCFSCALPGVSLACSLNDMQVVVDVCAGAAKNTGVGRTARANCDGGNISHGVEVVAPDGYVFFTDFDGWSYKKIKGRDNSGDVALLRPTREAENNPVIRQFPVKMSRTGHCRTRSGLGENCEIQMALVGLAVSKSCVAQSVSR